jgi:Ca2+-binding RTX toxin-like protein
VVVSREYRTYVDDGGDTVGEFVDLRVTLASTGESILFQDFSRSDDPDLLGNPLQRIEFDDGTTWDLDTICARTNRGTIGNDDMKGFGGTPEPLEGLEGNDTIEGNGEDTLLGGDGDDHLLGRGNDSLSGGAGNDFLQGGARLEGGSGDDTLYNSQSMHGDDGNDYLSLSTYLERATLEGGNGDGSCAVPSTASAAGVGNDEIRVDHYLGGLASEASHAVIRRPGR